jgi:hypothetical protein
MRVEQFRHTPLIGELSERFVVVNSWKRLLACAWSKKNGIGKNEG